MAKSVVKSVFSLHPLPVISTPKPPFFVHFGRFGGKNHLLRGVFLFSSRDFLAQNLILRRKNQFDGEFLFGIRPYFDFVRRGKGGKQALFSPSPTPFEKYKPTFSPNVPTFRDFLPCFISNLPTPTPTPLHSYAQDTRLRVYTRPRTQRVCHFCLHPSPSPQQSEKQHIARHLLQKIGEGKRVKPSHITHSQSTFYTQKVKR